MHSLVQADLVLLLSTLEVTFFTHFTIYIAWKTNMLNLLISIFMTLVLLFLCIQKNVLPFLSSFSEDEGFPFG